MKRKLWAALLLVYLIIVICVNYMYINYKRITLTNYNQRLKQVTSDYSNFLQNEITTINSLIKNTGVLLLHQTDAHHDINKEIVETFKNTQNDLPLIKSIYFVGNDDGRYIDYTGVHPVETLGGADYRRRPWYTTAITSQNPVISEVYSDLITEKPVITISYALRKDDKSIGVIAADLFLEDISLVYGFITNSKDIKFIILDSKKNLILHPIKELVGSNISESNLDMLAIKSDKEKLEINKEFDELSKKLGSLGSTGNLTYKSMLGFKAYGFYQTIPNMSWYILAVANVDSLLRSYLLTLIIFTSIAGFSISLILYKWINIIYYNDTILPCFKINKLLDDISSPANKKEDAILLFIDIHSFSDISRQYGSRVSDEVLKKYVNSIKSMLSKNELLTHARSDNFILMFKNSDWENALNKSKLLFTELGNFTLKFDNFSMPISSFMALTKLNPSHLGDAEKSLYTIRKSLEATKYKYLNELLVFPNVNDAMDMQNREKAKRNLVLETIVNGKVVPFFNLYTT